jgi:hypothetical protein
MRLLMHTKNMALVRDMEITDGPTPRVGEVLAMPELAADCGGIHTFLVVDVCWLLTDGRLSPEITARATEPDANRLHFLTEMGWLAPLPAD